MEINNFNIADFDIQIAFCDTTVNGMHLLSSFKPFSISQSSGNILFRLTVDDTLRPVPKEKRQRIRTFDTGNGDTIVDRVMMEAISTSSRTSTGATAVCCSATRTLQTAAVRSTAAGICASSD